MEIKIVNPTAPDFATAVGISEERSNELGRQLDQLIEGYGSGAVRTCDVFNDIAHFCHNTEELIFCTISHCNWRAFRGEFYYCPPKNQ